jgi:preprotein translocase SecF subunit
MKLNAIKIRFISYIISWVLFLFSIFAIWFLPLNLWIDMTGWEKIEYSYTHELDLDKFKSEVKSFTEEFDKKNNWIINNTQSYKVAWENTVVVVAWFDEIKNTKDISLEDLKKQYKDELTMKLWTEFSEDNYTSIWKSFWDYIKNTAFLTLIVAIISIALYIAYAFNWHVAGISALSFATITIITLFHDVFISSGLYIITSSILPEFQIDTFFITALLTILWYSINDTIVVLDRIRANLKVYGGRGKSLEVIINDSVNETITRSIYTSLTVLAVLLSILFFGPETVKGFVLVMVFGTIVWTFSSIFIASPILFELNKNKILKKYEEPKDED